MVKRYDWDEFDGHVPHESGDWVKFEDYEKLEKQNKRLREGMEKVKAVCPYCLIVQHKFKDFLKDEGK